MTRAEYVPSRRSSLTYTSLEVIPAFGVQGYSVFALTRDDTGATVEREWLAAFPTEDAAEMYARRLDETAAVREDES